MNNLPKSSNGMPLPLNCPAIEASPLGPVGDLKPPETGNEHGRLSETETEMILRLHLLNHHRRDPNILKFISSYIRCRSHSQAAEEAGLNPRDGYHLKNKPDINAAINALTLQSVQKYGFDASEVVERVKEISFIDPIEFVNPDGSFKTNMSEIAPEARRAIKKFKAKNIYETDPNGMPKVVGQMIEVELWDKTKAIELLGRESDLFIEKKKVEHDFGKNMSSLLLSAKDRADQRGREVDAAREVMEIQGSNENK